jgi:hypothetical protein
MTADAGNRRWKALGACAATALTIVLSVGSIALSFCPLHLSWLAWAGLIVSLSAAGIFVRDALPIASSAQRDATNQVENRLLGFVIAAPVVATVAWLLLSSLWGV